MNRYFDILSKKNTSIRNLHQKDPPKYMTYGKRKGPTYAVSRSYKYTAKQMTRDDTAILMIFNYTYIKQFEMTVKTVMERPVKILP